MPKRRRVDLSLRLEEAKAAVRVLWDGLLGYQCDDDDARRRARRVITALERGIKYVTEVNPSHGPRGARTRTP